MPRTIRNPKLDTRSARARLAIRREPYWTPVQQGLALGYRRAPTGGTWIARRYDRDASPALTYKALGAADDALDADGIATLDFGTAQARARTWFADRAKSTADPDAPSAGPYTVADAIREYLEWYAVHRKALREVEYRVNAYVLPALGALEVSALRTTSLRRWHEALATAPRRVRGKKGAAPTYRATPTDPETIRKRRFTANKTLIVLKAALNRAWREGRVADDLAWRRVTPFRDVDQPRVRWLTADEAVRLVNAAEPTFRPMIQAALLTGLRYGELAALRIADFDSASKTVHVATSKSGKPRRVPLNDEGARLFAATVAGRAPDALMFSHADGEAWGKSHQRRPMAEACSAARITPAVGFHVLRHTYGSALAMQGVPLGVIAAALGHADTRVTERHYAALAPSYVAETIRAKLPALGIVAQGNVAAMSPRRAATART
ncbi:MAG: site-specific integrase [Alphaproteobacteria bacterium]